MSLQSASKHENLSESWSQTGGSDGVEVTWCERLRRCHLEAQNTPGNAIIIHAGTHITSTHPHTSQTCTTSLRLKQLWYQCCRCIVGLNIDRRVEGLETEVIDSWCLHWLRSGSGTIRVSLLYTTPVKTRETYCVQCIQLGATPITEAYAPSPLHVEETIFV